MAVTRVTNTKNGSAAIRYAFEEPSHKEGMDRVLASSGHNLDTNFAMEQMRAVWKSHGKNDGKHVQVYRIIQSFGLNELDPANDEDIEKANAIGYETAAELYPDRQILVATQADGDGGKLHNHIIVNSVQFESGKSLRGKDTTSFKRVSEHSDSVLKRHGIKPLESTGERRKETMAEVKMRQDGEYVWKDDLTERIEQCVSEPDVTSHAQFIDRMKEKYGVEATLRGKRDPKMSYKFSDAADKERKARASRLGASYETGGLEQAYKANADKAKASAQAENARDAVEIEKRTDPLDFDFGAMVADIRPTVKKQAKPRRKRTDAEIKAHEARTEQIKNDREIASVWDSAHEMNDMFDAEKAEQARADQKATEQQRIAREAAEKREAEEKAKAEARRQAAEAQQKLLEEKNREAERERVSEAIFPAKVDSEEFLDKYLKVEQERGETYFNKIISRDVPVTPIDIEHWARIELADEKKAAERGHAVAVEQAEPEQSGPDV